MPSTWCMAVALLVTTLHLHHVVVVAQHNLNHAQRRDVIAQLFEWHFDDIAAECERVLGPKGYAAVQVSPINEHLVFEGRPWWERYQPISYRIRSRSGDEQQFAAMTRRCNRVGVRVYVDVVLNHMAGENPPPVVGSAGSSADPAAFSYPGVPFEREHFRDPCIIENWNGEIDLRNCQVAGMPDLNQTLPYVREQQVAFLNKLVRLGAAGFRVDAAKHMWPLDLYRILSAVDDLSEDEGFAAGTRPFVLLEMVDFGSDPGEQGRWQYVRLGRITDFLVPGELGRAFRGYNNLKYLRNWGPIWTFLPTQFGVVFLTDHEIQRGQGLGGQDIITFREPKLYKMATAFMLAHPLGTPRILSSYQYVDINQGPPQNGAGEVVSPDGVVDAAALHCGSDWVCEHRWRAVANMVELRAEVGAGTAMNGWWDNGLKHIAFSRGARAFVAFDGHKRQAFDWHVQTCLPAGRYCDVIGGEAVSGRCTGGEVVVEADGRARVRIAEGSEDGVLAIHVGASSSLSRSCPRMELNALFEKYWTTSCFRSLREYLTVPKRL